MYRFFVEPQNICGSDIYIEGPDVNHIKNVLRMKIGEEVSVVATSNTVDSGIPSVGAISSDPGVPSVGAISSDVQGSEVMEAMKVSSDNREYRCEIAGYEDDRVHLKLRFIKEDNVELPCKIYLFQGLPKSDKMEFIIQKAVELGVYEIIPVAMKRSVVKLDKKREASRITRYNAIAEAAAKQSRRRIIPEVKQVMTFMEAVEYSKDADVKLLPYELADMEAMDRTRDILAGIKPGQSVAVFIGPEGGFDEGEVDLAIEGDFDTITLGRRILRTETAGMTVLSWLVYLLE